jgi:hypothetical protein
MPTNTPSHIAALAALVLLAPPSAAATGVGTLAVEYTGYSHGFTVLKLTGTLTLSPSGYAAHVTFHTAGFAGMVVHLDNDSQVSGAFQGNQALPSLFEGSGHLRGNARATKMTWTDGNPTVQLLVPPAEPERTAVAPADTVHTIDTLSAVAALIHQVGQTGRCDGTLKTFDGRRLAVQSAHTAGQDTLPPTDRSVFSGQAMRCDFEGQQLGGFKRDESLAELKKPRHGSAWVAEMVPGAPPVPVRIAFENDLLGQVTLYVTAASGAKEGAK